MPDVVLIAPDKFRGTATARAMAEALAGAAEALGFEVRVLPLSDGGEGFLEVMGGVVRVTAVTGPAGDPVEAEWRMVDRPGGGRLAVIEAARACGLLLAGGAERNDPVAAGTTGVGELVLAARDAGAVEIVLGCGGSASTDGGLGLVRAVDGGGGLGGVRISAATDVRTRFLDAATVFGPQKGAGPEQVGLLTGRLHRVAAGYRERSGVDVTGVDGSGAAGGLAGGVLALGGRIVPGLDTVADVVGLDHALAAAGVVVTGEGTVDDSSWNGKVVGELVARARPGSRVVVVAGVVAGGTRRASPRADVEVSMLSLSERFGLEAAVSDTLRCARELLLEELGR